MDKTIRDYGDYLAMAARMEIARNEQDIAEGRILLVKCPDCGFATTQAEIDCGEHELSCYLSWPANPEVTTTTTV